MLEFCFPMVGRAKMKDSKSNVAMNTLLKAPKGRRITRPGFHGLYLYWKWTWNELLPLLFMGFCPHWAPSGHPRQAVTAVPPCHTPSLLCPCSRTLLHLPAPGARGEQEAATSPTSLGKWKTIRMKKALKTDPKPGFLHVHWLPTSVQGCFSFSVDLGMYRGESFYKSCPFITLPLLPLHLQSLPSIKVPLTASVANRSNLLHLQFTTVKSQNFLSLQNIHIHSYIYSHKYP